jgi:soluble lytic murein transglycosylase
VTIEQFEAYRHLFQALACLLSFGLSAPALPFDVRVQHNDVRRAVSARDYASGVRLLNEFAREAPKQYELNNFDYLHARLAEQAGDAETAKRLYQAVMRRPGAPFTPYCLRRLADIARREGDLGAEQTHLRRLASEFAASQPARGARARLAESLEDAGKLPEAIEQYRPLAVQDRDFEGKLALALRKAGRTAEARAVFVKLLRTGKDDQALLAAEALDQLGDETLTEAEHLARGRLFLANRHSEGATRHFTVIVEKFPQSRARAEAVYGVGRAAYILERWDEAIRWYDRVHDEYPTSPEGEKGFYQVGHAHQNAGRHREAVARYEATRAAYPNGEYVGGAHLNAIDSLRLAGDAAGALDWCDRAERRFPKDLVGATATFQRAKILLSIGKTAESLAVFSKLQNAPLNQRGPGSTNANEIAFMRAYCLEKLGRYAEAVDGYLALPDTRESYYGQRASDRLAQLRADAGAKSVVEARFARFSAQAKESFDGRNFDAAKTAAQQAIRLTDDAPRRAPLFQLLERCYRNLPAYAVAWNYQVAPVGRPLLLTEAEAPARRAPIDEFCFLGLFDEAAPLMTEASGAGAFSLAVYANRGSQAYRAIAYGEPTFGKLPSDFRLEVMPRDVAELLYPAPYRDALTDAARPRRVDARLLLAIARQESRFRPWVKSAVAARGLFQFIDATADQIAKELNLASFSRDDLYDPNVAVKFGAQYVANLFKRFPNHPPAVAAAYNGGEAGVERWLQRAGREDTDRFAIEVGFVETKDYVFKVLANYRAYRQLYDAELRPATR